MPVRVLMVSRRQIDVDGAREATSGLGRDCAGPAEEVEHAILLAVAEEAVADRCFAPRHCSWASVASKACPALCWKGVEEELELEVAMLHRELGRQVGETLMEQFDCFLRSARRLAPILLFEFGQ